MKRLLIASLVALCTSAYANDIGDAQKMCEAFEDTQQVLSCTVNNKNKTISVSMYTTPMEARKICKNSAEQIRQIGVLKGWHLWILVPVIAGKRIESCGCGL